MRFLVYRCCSHDDFVLPHNLIDRGFSLFREEWRHDPLNSIKRSTPGSAPRAHDARICRKYFELKRKDAKYRILPRFGPTLLGSKTDLEHGGMAAVAGVAAAEAVSEAEAEAEEVAAARASGQDEGRNSRNTS